MGIDRLDVGLYRLNVPFEDLTTAVYFAVYTQGAAIIDSATYPSDVDNYILPALKEIGLMPADVTYILLTHHHGDHAGGASCLAQRLQHAKVGTSFSSELPNRFALEDGQTLLDGLQVVHLPGHTDTTVGFLDVRTGTLLSGDCLQLKGIGRYRRGVSDKNSYIASVQKLKTMPIRRIVAAHEFDPLGSLAEGTEAVKQYLDCCLQCLE